MRNLATGLVVGWFLWASPAQSAILLIGTGEDTAPYAFLPSLVRGGRETLFAVTSQPDENGLFHHFETYVRFDLPPGLLGPGERVDEASAIFAYSLDDQSVPVPTDPSAVPGEIRCHEVLQPWSQSTMKWTHRPAIGAVFDQVGGIVDLGFYFCDVTQLVSDWVTGVRPNYGIALTNTTPRLLGMFSFDAISFDGVPVDPALRPRLAIRTVPSGIADADSDGVADGQDNCVAVPNALQEDLEGDGVGDACDNCSLYWNPSQEDSNVDQLGDACSLQGGDINSDGKVNEIDLVLISIGLGHPENALPEFAGSDMDGDGFISQNDFNLWKLLYNAFYTGPPTPYCGLLGVEPLFLAAWAIRRRRAAVRTP